MDEKRGGRGSRGEAPRGGRGAPARGARVGGPRGGGGEERLPPRPRGASSEELLDLVDELEEHARALLGLSRKLQRLATSLEGGGGGGGGGRAPRGRGGAGGGEARGGSRGAERPGGEERPKRRSTGEAPSWAPAGKRRRS
jgi:hypothetical protein